MPLLLDRQRGDAEQNSRDRLDSKARRVGCFPLPSSSFLFLFKERCGSHLRTCCCLCRIFRPSSVGRVALLVPRRPDFDPLTSLSLSPSLFHSNTDLPASMQMVCELRIPRVRRNCFPLLSGRRHRRVSSSSLPLDRRPLLWCRLLILTKGVGDICGR